MLAASAFIDGALQGLIYTVVAAFVIGIARAAIQTTRKRQTMARDNQSLTEFFFDTPKNERTGVPAKKGWTTVVNETLAALVNGQSTVARSQTRIENLVHDIRSEVKPDGNGGHNMRGELQALQRTQTEERDRVQGRDDAHDREDGR